MDGTALYQSVAAIFLMQVFGIPVTPGAVGIILATAVLASIGTPGTPGVGIVVLAGILEANGVPASGVALILGVDRILDMCRTTINVTGDQAACIVMEKLAGSKLQDLEATES
jgi:Na+/H+-dicarboxylate symporter